MTTEEIVIEPCFLCGNDLGGHHLGCAVSVRPGMTPAEAAVWGLGPALPKEPEPEPDQVEVLKEGSMTTEPVVGVCALEGCDNPKNSIHVRAKYCEAHKDPKSRKE